jgi:hypothetical protein
MRLSRPLRLLAPFASLVVLQFALLPQVGSASSAASSSPHQSINCDSQGTLCTEVVDSYKVFDNWSYVGHDEPSLLFYSNRPGSGNRMQYQFTLPSDPPGTSPSNAYNFQLHPAFWFGMAMCDTQSWPEQLSTCTPDSDSNISDPAVTPVHAGTAFMEMQFYPPGWVPFQLPGGISCSATQWCAALNIDSLSQNAVTGQALNRTCTSAIGSIEYVNFAFLTTNGVSQAPANPVQATAATYTPDPSRDLFMNSGDQLQLSMHDSSQGLVVVVNDLTTGRTGSMTASAGNGFGQVLFAPDPSKTCQNIPYDFHPMYSTSSPQTRVTWAAHTYNIAFSDEIGHFDYCSNPSPTLNCSGTEGTGSNVENSDKDDSFCWPASASTLIQVNGCANSNVPGFDGTSYLNDWPNGSPNNPTPVVVRSPRTGQAYNFNYDRVAFETDLPRVEEGLNGCDPFSATGCTHIPIADDGTPADFYPFYSTSNSAAGCSWVLGADIPGVTSNDFGQQQQYGNYDTGVAYTNGSSFYYKADDFRNILSNNPCPS